MPIIIMSLPVVIPACLIAAVLYMLMIMPKMTGKVDMKPFGEWMYAHRGLHDNSTDAPENSIKAIQKAVDAGFGIEIDIQLTKDNIPIVFHDFTLARMCRRSGKVRDFTYEELQEIPLYHTEEKIPKLEDVLKLVDGRVPLIVEFKSEITDMSLCRIADKLLREYKGMYCVESFNPLCVLWFRRHHREIARGQLSDGFVQKYTIYDGLHYFFLENLMFNWVGKPDFVAYNYAYREVRARRLCRDLYHNTAVGWTIHSDDELEIARDHFDIFIFEGFIPEKQNNV